MFTGITQAKGRILALEQRAGDRRYRIDCGALGSDCLGSGDSIAVSGVCLTVVTARDGEIEVDVPGTPLGGHFVTGHVDGVGVVASLRPSGRCVVLDIEIPAALTRYVAPKGSICLDGVSLTVNQIEGRILRVNIIPHTLEQTTLAAYQTGRRVNVEVDLLARYLERLLQAGGAGNGAGIDGDFLRRHGFSAAD